MRTRTVRLTLLLFLVSLPALFLVLAQFTLREFEGLRRGDLMPRATLRTVGDIPVETASWLGAPTLLVVFQPGCEACRREIDALAAIAPSFPELRIGLLSTALDIGEMVAPFPVYIDRDGHFLKQVRKLIAPAIYWIDAAGKVRYARAGQQSADEEQRLFRALLKGTPDPKALNESR